MISLQRLQRRHARRRVDGGALDHLRGRLCDPDPGGGDTDGRGGKEFADFLVADLTEVPERLPHREKGCGHRRADDVVDDAGELPAGRFRSRRHRDHDLGGVRLPQRLHRGQHAGPGGQPVVDEDHRLAGHVDGRPTAPVGGLAPDQFPPFTFGDVTQLLRRDPQGRAAHRR